MSIICENDSETWIWGFESCLLYEGEGKNNCMPLDSSFDKASRTTTMFSTTMFKYSIRYIVENNAYIQL